MSFDFSDPPPRPTGAVLATLCSAMLVTFVASLSIV